MIIHAWLVSNKLILNSDTTTLINFNHITEASSPAIALNKDDFSFQVSCKYFGVIVDDKLNFTCQIVKIKSKLGRHRGAISRFRFSVQRVVLI